MDQNPTIKPAAQSAGYLRLAVAHFGRDLAEDRERVDELIERADDADQPAVCSALVEAALQLDDARYELERALCLFK